MEEAGELIQAASKYIRFGDNREHLVQEMGDVLYAIDTLVAKGLCTKQDLINARERKARKYAGYIAQFGEESS